MDGGPLTQNPLGTYLRDRRAKLDPVAFGLPAGRRRTTGLRREEVAHRANISPTWYTCLEQGRGGGPSADVLDRLSRALMLTDIEREHLFLLGLGHPPEARYHRNDDVTPRLQRVLDALDPSPAFIRTAIWDVVAWNRAASAMLTDFGPLPPDQRNILRNLFLDPRARAAQYDWENVAPLVDELCRLSPDFNRMWRENDLPGPHGEAVKHMRHAVLGRMAFEFSAFAVDGRSDLTMVVYNPATEADAERIKALFP
jgi:transcriptional regulator with XRE-family HTH domain